MENNTKMEVQKIEIRSNHLNKQEKVEIEKLVRGFNDLFAKKGDILSHTSVIKHRINTTDEISIYTRQYRYPKYIKKRQKNKLKIL